MRLLPRFAACTLAFGLGATGLSTASSASDSSARAIASGDGRDEAVDIAQVVGSRVYHLTSGGLLIYEATDPDRPQLVGKYPIVGSPLGVVVRGSVATILMRWSDVSACAFSFPGPARVRALDVRDPARIQVLGESTIEGDLQDARATADSMYVVSESHSAGGGQVIVTSLRLDGSNTSAVHTTRRGGSAPSLRWVAGRVVIAYADENGSGTHIEVLVDSAASGLVHRGSIDLPATIGRAVRDTSERLNAEDAAHVHVIGCRTAACGVGDTLEVATVDTTDHNRPRIHHVSHLPSPGESMVTRFNGERLYLSRRGWLSLGSPSTPIVTIDLDAPGQSHGREQVVEGVVWNLVPVGDGLMVLATRGDAAATREQLILSVIDPRGGQQSALPTEIVLGNEWTSSSAQETSHAVIWCGGNLAVPFRTWQVYPFRVQSRVTLVGWTAQGLTSIWDVPVDGNVARGACVHDRLLVLTDSGLWSVDPSGARNVRVSRIELSAPAHLSLTAEGRSDANPH